MRNGSAISREENQPKLESGVREGNKLQEGVSGKTAFLFAEPFLRSGETTNRNQ